MDSAMCVCVCVWTVHPLNTEYEGSATVWNLVHSSWNLPESCRINGLKGYYLKSQVYDFDSGFDYIRNVESLWNLMESQKIWRCGPLDRIYRTMCTNCC